MKKFNSIDGIILQKNDNQNSGLGNPKVVRLDDKLFTKPKQKVPSPAPKKPAPEIKKIPTINKVRNLDSDLSETLKNLEAQKTNELPIRDTTTKKKSRKNKLSHKERKLLKKEKKLKNRKRRRIVKICVTVFILLIVGSIAWIGLRGMETLCRIFQCDPRNPFGLIRDIMSPIRPLRMDENGRTNILVLGTDDDNLTDSIMVLSIHQTERHAFMISLPRDLWVDYGQACPSGFRGKINAVYYCFGGATGNLDQDRQALERSMKFFGDVLDIDIQYAAHINYDVFLEAVDAVGGSITVEINSRDPRGILDGSFDSMCGQTAAERRARCPSGHFLHLSNGVHTLDSKMALVLAKARGTYAPTYGLEMGNFDREKNQQMIAKAILDEATSVGVLANPATILALLDSLGDNLRTTFSSSDIRTLINLAQNIDLDEIESLSLIDEGLLTTDMIAGQSVVIPTAGVFDYTEIRRFLARSMSNDPLMRENATISVYNGSGIVGAASRTADRLTDRNLNATAVGNTSSISGSYRIYDLTDGKKSETSRRLSEILSTNVQRVSRNNLPGGITTSADFVVIVGTP